jgi:hypothetical protein
MGPFDEGHIRSKESVKPTGPRNVSYRRVRMGPVTLACQAADTHEWAHFYETYWVHRIGKAHSLKM